MIFPTPVSVLAYRQHLESKAIEASADRIKNVATELAQKVKSDFAAESYRSTIYNALSRAERDAIVSGLTTLLAEEGYFGAFPNLHIHTAEDDHDNGYGRQTKTTTFILYLR